MVEFLSLHDFVALGGHVAPLTSVEPTSPGWKRKRSGDGGGRGNLLVG